MTETTARIRTRRSPRTFRPAVVLWLLPGPVAMAAFSLACAHPGFVDEVFAARWYPLAARWLSRLSAAPFAVAPVLVLAAALWFALGLAFSIIKSAYAASARPFLRALYIRATAAGCAYFLLMSIWGMQYARTPLSQTISYSAPTSHASAAFAASRPGETSSLKSPLEALCEKWIAQANALQRQVWDSTPARILKRVPEAFERARRTLDYLPDIPVPEPKPSGMNPLLTRMMIEGVFVPFTFEALVNTAVPAVDLPFVACHEVAHALGFAREDEANMVAYEVCIRSNDSAFRYSGVMSALRYGMARLAKTQPRLYWSMMDRMTPGVRLEFAARGAYWNDVVRDNTLARWANMFNDLFLSHAAKQEGGASSYEGMIDGLTESVVMK